MLSSMFWKSVLYLSSSSSGQVINLCAAFSFRLQMLHNADSLLSLCGSLAETKPTKLQKLQKETLKIVQKSCKIDALGVILE